MKLTRFVKIIENKILVNGKLSKTIMPTNDNFTSFAKQIYADYAIDYRKFFKMDNLCKLGFLNSEILLKDIDLLSYKPEEIGLLLVNSSGSLNDDMAYQETLKDLPSPKVFVYTLPNIVLGEISIRNNFKGESIFFVDKKFSTEFFYDYTKLLINNYQQKAIITGWVEIDMNDNYESYMCLIEDSENDEFTAKDIDEFIKINE